MVVAHKSSTEDIGVLRRIFKKYDSRHTGSICFEEFCEDMSGYGKSEDELRFIFDAMVRTLVVRSQLSYCVGYLFDTSLSL